MFQVVEKHQRSVKVIIGLLALTFIGFSGGMMMTPNNNYLVKVGDEEITDQDVMRVAQGVDGATTDEVKKNILDVLVNQSYLLAGAKKLGITVSPEQIKQVIMAEASFQNNGIFSEELYKNYLKQSNLTEDMFVENIRREFVLMSVLNLINNGQMVSDAQAKQLIGLMQSERDIRTVSFNNAMWEKDIKVTDDEVKKYYDSHQKEYMQAQGVKFEFVVLAAGRLLEKQTVTEEELLNAYNAEKANLKPTRQIAHILISAPASASAEEKQAAKKKAEEVLAKVKAKPADFASLAKQYSDDKASAEKGGDLGNVRADGSLGQALEDSAFKLKKDDVSDVVSSDFGYHIIKVLAIQASPSMESMKSELTAKIKEQKALKAVRESKDQMADLAFNHPTDLKELAKKLNITVEQSGDWITEAEAKANQMPEELIKAIFSQEAIAAKHNSEPITVEDNSIWVVRPTEVRAAKQLTLAEVKDQVHQQVFNNKLNELVKKKAEEILVKLNKGEKVDLPWSPKQVMTTEMAKQNLPPQAYEQMLAAKPANGKPAYVLLDGLPVPVLMEVANIRLPGNIDEMLPQAKKVLTVQQGEVTLSSYLKALGKEVKTQQGNQSIVSNNNAIE